MRIEVRPIEVSKWHGKKGKESFKRAVKLEALVDPDKMEYATGLTKQQADKYGELLRQDLSPQFVPGTPHPFWNSSLGVVKLENRTMFFDTDNPLDFIHVSIMKASKFVANSKKEWEEGKFPEAEFLIHDELEEVEVQAAKLQVKQKAIIASASMSKSAKAEIILILDGKNLKGKSDDFIDVEMFKIIERDPRNALRYIQRDKKENALEALVTEALQKSVLKKKGHRIYFFESVLGSDITEVGAYLMDDENQDLKLRIMELVNS